MPVGRQVLSGKPRLASGQRDKLVTIQQRPVADSGGGSGFPVEDTWTTLRTAWMSRLDVRADERFTTSQETASAETTWHMSFTPDMDPEVVDVPKLRRLLFRGRTYDILSASLMGREEGIELMTLAASRVA